MPALDLLALDLDPDPLDPASVLEGDPRTASRTLETVAGAERGVWEITPGTVRDTEVAETFVVLAGRATVEVEGGAPFELAPGVAGRFHGGERTTWRVHQRLRKAYELAPTTDEESR